MTTVSPDDLFAELSVAPAVSLNVSTLSPRATRKPVVRGVGEVSVNLLHGDCLAVMKTLEDNSVDSIVTDPPYGLAPLPADKIMETMVQWCSGDRSYIPEGAGFMGRTWDAFIPPPAVWDEAFRVLKPGGHIVAFAGSRTQDLMGLSIRLAGFEIRDNLAWLYGSGFPKSMDVSKQLDKMELSDEADKWKGWGTALKPAHEPVLCAQKPFNMVPLDKSLADYADKKFRGTSWVSTSCVKHAGIISASSLVEPHEGMSDSVQANAGTVTSREESARMATCNSLATGLIFSNTVMSWNSIWELLSDPMTTYTISMKSSMTTGLRILNSLLDQATSGIIMPVCGCSQDGEQYSAGNAAETSSAGSSSLNGIRTATAHENAMSLIVHEVQNAVANIVGLVSSGLEEGSIARSSALTGPAMTSAGSGNDDVSTAGTRTSQTGRAAGTAPFGAQDTSMSEPIILARKPLSENTVAQNVLTHGTGAINIDACRIGLDSAVNIKAVQRQKEDTAGMKGIGGAGYKADHVQATYNVSGRFPANILLDRAAADELDKQSGNVKGAVSNGRKMNGAMFDVGEQLQTASYSDQGGASRFFMVADQDELDVPVPFHYSAKAPKSERPVVNGVAHVTVKPLSTMRWLVKLITPPGGTVLEPFAGSGTTVEAAIIEGFDVIAIEREDEYIPLIEERVNRQLRKSSAA